MEEWLQRQQQLVGGGRSGGINIGSLATVSVSWRLLSSAHCHIVMLVIDTRWEVFTSSFATEICNRHCCDSLWRMVDAINSFPFSWLLPQFDKFGSHLSNAWGHRVHMIIIVPCRPLSASGRVPRLGQECRTVCWLWTSKNKPDLFFWPDVIEGLNQALSVLCFCFWICFAVSLGHCDCVTVILCFLLCFVSWLFLFGCQYQCK